MEGKRKEEKQRQTQREEDRERGEGEKERGWLLQRIKNWEVRLELSIKCGANL